MSFSVVATSEFEKELKHLAKKYPSIQRDFTDFLQSLQKNSAQGTSLGNNCYKIRFGISSKGKGKSGGARVITCVLVQSETILLISIYDKSEQTTITNNEIKERLNRYLKK